MSQTKKAQVDHTGQIRIKIGPHSMQPWVQQPKMFGQILTVAYGAGVDSTAMLVLLKRQGIRPDLIQFADVGDEKPATYAYLATMNAWCAKVGFPQITIVKRNSPDAGYVSLSDECLRRPTPGLPALAFGGHTCSSTWKAGPQTVWMNSHEPACIGWALGMKVLKAIGYDNGAADSKRCNKVSENVYKSDEKYDNIYPLRDAGLDRDACKALIADEGLPVPPKSSCFMCPAMHKDEIVDLGEKSPELLARALKVEAVYRAGAAFAATEGNPKSTVGLGRNFAWVEYLATAHPKLLARLEAEHDCGQEERNALAARLLQKS